MDNKTLCLFLVLVLCVGLQVFFNLQYSLESYSNYNLENTLGKFPDAVDKVLVQDTYPRIEGNQLSNNTSYDIWWHYPVFKLGSYAQITNNFRYQNNPDEGTCMPASMCGALYKDKKLGPKTVELLKPVNPNCGTRVGFFNTDTQLINSLPYKSDLANILY